MNISVFVHLKNVYVKHQVVAHRDGFDVFKGREHVLCVRDGQDLSERLGCSGRFSLDPIPKLARVLCEKNGAVVPHAQAAERTLAREKFLDKESGRILSVSELKKQGWSFDDHGNVLSEPQSQAS